MDPKQYPRIGKDPYYGFYFASHTPKKYQERFFNQNTKIFLDRTVVKAVSETNGILDTR